MTWGFIWRLWTRADKGKPLSALLWTNCPPPPPTGRQEREVTNAQMSRGSHGQRPGSSILSKSKRNVYYHWNWTSPLKNCTLWLEASSENSEPTVAPYFTVTQTKYPALKNFTLTIIIITTLGQMTKLPSLKRSFSRAKRQSAGCKWNLQDATWFHVKHSSLMKKICTIWPCVLIIMIITWLLSGI